MTDRVLLGKNANSDFGFWISKPGVNVHSAASDPWGFQQEFRFRGLEDATYWKKFPGVEHSAYEPLKITDENIIKFKEDGLSPYIYSPECGIYSPSPFARIGDAAAIIPFDGETNNVLEMNVRSTSWGNYSVNENEDQTWRLSFIVDDYMTARPMRGSAGNPVFESLLGLQVRLYINHAANDDQVPHHNWAYGTTTNVGINAYWQVGDLVDIYVANLGITVRSKIIQVTNYRSFLLNVFGEYGFPYYNDLSMNDTFTNIDRFHPAPVVGVGGQNPRVDFHQDYSYALGNDAFPSSYRGSTSPVAPDGPWNTIEWDFSELPSSAPSSIVGVKANKWTSNLNILATKIAMHHTTGNHRFFEIASVRSKNKITNVGLPAHPNSLQNLLMSTGSLGTSGVELMHAGLVHQTGVVKVGTGNDTVGFSGGIWSTWDDWIVSNSGPAGGAHSAIFTYADGSTDGWLETDGPMENAWRLWSWQKNYSSEPDQITIAGHNNHNDFPASEVVKIQNVSLPGKPIYNVISQDDRWESGDYTLFDLTVDTNQVIQEDALPSGVVELANPLPYIPFILFQRFDGTSTDPVRAYPANQMDISYCGIMGKTNLGVLEHKSSHTDPTLWAGDMGYDLGNAMAYTGEQWGQRAFIGGGPLTDVMGDLAQGGTDGEWCTNNPHGYPVTGTDNHYGPEYKSGTLGSEGYFRGHKYGDWMYSGRHDGGPRSNGPWYAPIICPSPGIVYKWMVMQTIKMRTFAYCRAGKDRFEITARNALGIEGNEDAAHGTYQRADNGDTLEYMWDQKDCAANGVLPPSVYTAEYIDDWGREDAGFQWGRVPDDVPAGSGTNYKHEHLPGLHFGGTGGPSRYNKPPWDWGGVQCWPEEEPGYPTNNDIVNNLYWRTCYKMNLDTTRFSTNFTVNESVYPPTHYIQNAWVGGGGAPWHHSVDRNVCSRWPYYEFYGNEPWDRTSIVKCLGSHTPVVWPPGGLYMASYNPGGQYWATTTPGPALEGGYAAEVGGISPGTDTTATQGITHPRGVSDLSENVAGSITDNQTYDLVHNNESTGQCTYRYYVLRIPANLNASQMVSNLPDNAGLIV